MHMADALVAPAVAVTMYAASTLATGYSIKKVTLEEDIKKVPMMGVMGAFVFAAQMINFTIPGTGSSGHIVGGLLLAAVLGPYAGFITMVGVLLVQCLLFADGGLLALGCNIWNMAFFFCIFGYFCVYKPILKKGFSRKKIILASVLGCVLSLQLGSLGVVIETSLSGITELPFTLFLTAMQPIQLAIGLIEGLVTAAVLIFIYDKRPELLNSENLNNKMSGKKIIGIFVGASAVLIGGLSWFASSNPDGLEWSIQKLTGATELDKSGGIYDTAGQVQGITAIFPDYTFGEGASSLISLSLIILVFLVLIYLVKFFIKRKNHKYTG